MPVKPNQPDLGEEDALAKTKAIRERLVKGEDFAAVAKAESDDTGSGAQGGDLGTFGHGRMVPVFEETAFKLPIGEVSQPVKSQFGWHLIQVQERTVKNFADGEGRHRQAASDRERAEGHAGVQELDQAGTRRNLLRPARPRRAAAGRTAGPAAAVDRPRTVDRGHSHAGRIPGPRHTWGRPPYSQTERRKRSQRVCREQSSRSGLPGGLLVVRRRFRDG